tara:strand:- start:8136 stop:8849 length:714 start_codon:yes stop_codon:yes gene_type:complete
MKYNFIGNLIRAGGDAKTVKGNNSGYLTSIMYLKSFKTLGVNLCPNAEIANCFEPCLLTAGRGQMNSVQKGRLRKTEWFIKDRAGFMEQVFKDLIGFSNYCDKRELKPAIRLNGTSDIRFENIPIHNKTLMEHFPNIQFYDYTKIANRRNIPDNYHLTFSYSEANPIYQKQVNIALEKKMNIAVVFRHKENMPKKFLGLKVINGDKNDLRFLDPKNCVVGLYAKGKAIKDYSGFVID